MSAAAAGRVAGRAAGRPGSGRNVPAKVTFRRMVRNPSFSYSGLPRSVANSVTVASPASASRCSISARPRPRRPYRAATSIIPAEARSGPYLASTTAQASPPSGASTPKASASASRNAHLARSGDQPRSADSATQRLRSPGPSLRMGGKGTPLRSVSTFPQRMTTPRGNATGLAAASRPDEQPPLGGAPAGRHHQVDRGGQRRERGDDDREVRQDPGQRAGRAPGARGRRRRRHSPCRARRQPADHREDREEPRENGSLGAESRGPGQPVASERHAEQFARQQPV